ncbi:MAG: ABC transporter ATP-binding protein [Proteobacteria bacterium]|nr:MAG: ABC transporter ATP-binding protein [Pseudomonadota bacterium]
MSEPVLVVDRLHRMFGESVALENLSFSLSRGEVVGLLGANGAGKTTAMSIILGLTTATSGSVSIFGMDPLKNRIAVLRRTNYASAYTDLPGNLSVAQNLRVFAGIYRVKKPGPKIHELLEMLEIAHLKDRTTGHLSAGESTRLHLCKALLNDPELLLLDEPTASLDPDIADKVRKILRRIQQERGIAILYTSHNMRDIEEVCDRVIFMHQGKVVTEGSPAQVISRFGQPTVKPHQIFCIVGPRTTSVPNPFLQKLSIWMYARLDLQNRPESI